VPIYEWKCDDCKEVTEVDKKISEYNDPVDCGSCGSANTKRQIPSGTTFNLEGGGWFKDGY
jgi:putative FmdB family regulatory protein